MLLALSPVATLLVTTQRDLNTQPTSCASFNLVLPSLPPHEFTTAPATNASQHFAQISLLIVFHGVQLQASQVCSIKLSGGRVTYEKELVTVTVESYFAKKVTKVTVTNLKK